jgi:hypothetical protein
MEDLALVDNIIQDRYLFFLKERDQEINKLVETINELS